MLSDLKEEEVTLASMMSISKGFYGECGRRGGYTELVNVDPSVISEVYKLASINLCSNLNGQICMALVMNPPKVHRCSSNNPQPYWVFFGTRIQEHHIDWHSKVR